MTDSATDSAPETPKISQEFFHRVNDFIEMANRIERRRDSAHAELVFLHAFSRYSAHHYRATAKSDTAENRNEFAAYMAAAIQEQVLLHLQDLAGQPAASEDSPEA